MDKPKETNIPLHITLGPIVKRNVRHNFTPEELAKISSSIVTALASKANLETEFDSIKASYKARISEQDSLIATCATAHRAGFEMRVRECQITFNTTSKMKIFTLVDTNEVVGNEPMTNEDFQMELLASEKDFERREEIVLCEVNYDRMIICVGRYKDKWYSAVRARLRSKELIERLDHEQKAYKERYDAIGQARLRLDGWIRAEFGAEIEKGFAEPFDKVILAHKERAE